jgi:O-antigen ligase
MTLLCFTAMFMTKSRAAAMLSLLAFIIAFICFFRRDLPGRTGIVSALIACGAIALVLLQTIGAAVNARFDALGFSGEGRLEVYKSTVRMIADQPWLGTGQGTFANAFPIYRSANSSIFGVWDMAHNTFLEIAAEMGLPIAALVIAAWVAILVRLVRGVQIRRRGILVPTAALAVGIIAVLHSLIDFILQIPGYAIVALCLIGAGVAQSFPEDATQRSKYEQDLMAYPRSGTNEFVNDWGSSKAKA